MKVLAVVALIGAGLYLAWTVAFPTYSYRFRLTIAAKVGEEVKSASSVIEVVARAQPEFGQAPPYDTNVYGDAVFLDLGEGRNVVATLMFGPTGQDFRLESLWPDLIKQSNIEIAEGLGYTDEKLTLAGGNIPTLVTFVDPNNPRSIRVVSPREFSREFGDDVRFLEATVQMTRDPVTRDIARQLPWIGNYDAELAAQRRMRADTSGGPSLLVGTTFRRE